MLKAVFIVDCDQCGQQFNRLAISFQTSQHAEVILCLQDLMQQDGWHVFRERYKCPDCCLEEQYTLDQLYG
jgi:hypothetical protein